jgi:hypothetical protein
MQMNRIRSVIVGVLILASVVGAYVALEPKAEPPPAVIEPDRGGAVLFGGGSGSSPVSPTEAHQASRPEQQALGPRIEQLRIQGLTGQDPLLAINALREMRVPGSYASARQIIYGCLYAYAGIQFANLKDLVNTPSYARRLSAAQQTEARCSRVFAVDLDAYKPLPGDLDGERYMAAKVKMTNWSSHKADIPRLIEVLVNQGRLVDASAFFRETQIWAGKRWTGEQDTYFRAIALAGLRVTGDAAQADKDLLVLGKCIRSGQCQGVYEQFPPDFPEQRKADVLALAAEMEAAFRTGDTKAFFGSKRP